ncbi:DNA-3-methyladenine glycosylase I [Cognaticolwellia beringensis]|uniref:3-methyladenine DNA glycosylase n=1 Tax=Cognaticolwellia beringensis TaxID=1967665 RepID=A0A222G8J4_9GAMM|nr:DNA-3-methyladenine glycosylase I [Cognaticolwellia beringensis]ASP47674.1 3-methyladenine DNA glycosylase [Cognaticolwellia beringensis]|tara:strand:- start:12415 stop:13128 length:714 start_codon:yes stop_codon:yes gene_type:complete
MALETLDDIYQRAAARKGGVHKLNILLGSGSQDHLLKNITDDRFLSEFSKKVFQSGFVWRVVENKWLNFEESFFNFNIEKVLMMPEEMMERKASDPKIIRNFNKVKTIKANAEMIFEEQQQGHSFAEFIANWPSDDIIGLWAYLKKHGQRLGGNTGPYALRALGKDTFLLSRDVEAYFRAHDIITGGIQTKSSLNAIQASFNSWQQQGDLSLGQLSRLIAYATGDNHIHLEEIADAE